MSRIVRTLFPTESRLSRKTLWLYSQLRAFCKEKNVQEASSDSILTKSSSDEPTSPRIPFEYPLPNIIVEKHAKSYREIFDLDWAHLKKFMADPKHTPFQRPIFLREYEFVVIGAGPIGSSIAYWLKKFVGNDIHVLVIDKDLSTNRYSRDIDNGRLAAALSVGQLRQLYSKKQNVELSQYSASFMRNMRTMVEHDDVDDIPYRPFGYLTLASPTGNNWLKEVYHKATKHGAEYELLTSFQVQQRYPWMNTEGIHAAVHGLHSEGWFDPWRYTLQLRNNAIRAGVVFKEAVPLEFHYKDRREIGIATYLGYEEGEYLPLDSIVIKTTEGELIDVKFAQVILALGADTGDFAKEMLDLDSRYTGMHQFEIPIKRRKRYVYSFEAPAGPEVASPMVVDPSGLYFRREGLLNNYICGCPPLPNQNSDSDNLDVDPNHFADHVWPILAARVPAFEQLRLTASWATFDEVNTFDGSPIIGLHPAFHNVFIAAGFGDRSFEHAIGVGRAVAETCTCILPTIDLKEFTFHRIVQNIPVPELNTLPS